MSTTKSCDASGRAFFTKSNRLRKAREFQRVYRGGRKSVSHSFVVFLLANGRDVTRFGLTTPGRLGTAPERNRIRRRVREMLRRERAVWPRGFDVVVNPRRSVLDRNYATLRTEFLSLLRTQP